LSDPLIGCATVSCREGRARGRSSVAAAEPVSGRPRRPVRATTCS
jgi:hypothetical protein